MKHSLVRSGIKLSILTLISRLLGLVREMTKASFLGTSALADAFGVAFMIPNLLRRLFAENSISVAFIPTFKTYLEEKIGKGTEDEVSRTQATRQFINATFTLVSFLTVIAVIIGIFITPLIVPLFAEGSDADILPEMAFLTRMMFPYLFVISVAAFFQGILNGVKIFMPSGFTPILFNILVIGATYLLSPFTENPARAMAYGVIAGGTVQALFQFPFVLRAGFRPAFTGLKTAFANPGTRRVLKLIGPTIIGMAVYQLNDVVSTALAGRAGTGIVSSLQYSLRLQELILGIFVVSIGTVILPDLAGFAKKKEWIAFNTVLSRATQIIALITIPITFFALLFGENIIILVYQSNRFSAESVALTLKAFTFHIMGLYFIALNRIIAPAFYAQSNTKSPTFAGIIGFVVNIVLALIFVRFMSGAGIALALSLASLANTIMLFIFLQNCVTIEARKLLFSIIRYTVKLVVCSIIATIAVYLVKEQLFAPFEGLHRFFAQGIPLFISAIIFALIGVILLVITRDPLIRIVIERKRKK